MTGKIYINSVQEIIYSIDMIEEEEKNEHNWEEDADFIIMNRLMILVLIIIKIQNLLAIIILLKNLNLNDSVFKFNDIFESDDKNYNKENKDNSIDFNIEEIKKERKELKLSRLGFILII